MRGFHRELRPAGDVVALVLQVDLAVRLDEQWRAVPATGRETRTDVGHRTPMAAAVGGLLHHNVQIASCEPAASAFGTDEGDSLGARTVIPGQIHRAIWADGNEVAVTPVVPLPRYNLDDPRERLTVIERSLDHRERVVPGRVHERRVDGAAGRHGNGWVPSARGVREYHRRGETQAAVGRGRYPDVVVAAHPLFVDEAACGVDRLL